MVVWSCDAFSIMIAAHALAMSIGKSPAHGAIRDLCPGRQFEHIRSAARRTFASKLITVANDAW
jgi:hypothetical protein